MSECSPWNGVKNRNGYGLVGRKLAHRLAWEEKNGEIPEGLVIHHDCRNPSCVNVDHLRCLTHAEHNALHLNAEPWYERQRSKTHCAKGHAYTDKTTGRDKLGKRYCKECARLSSSAYHKRNRDRLLPLMREREQKRRDALRGARKISGT